MYLKKEHSQPFANISKRPKEEQGQQSALYARFSKTEIKLQEEVIQRCFPDSVAKDSEEVAQTRHELLSRKDAREMEGQHQEK